MYDEESDKGSRRYKLWKYADEFSTYIESNKYYITNYAERHRYGEIISTSFVEATVNEVISKRMVKKTADDVDTGGGSSNDSSKNGYS